MVKTWELSKKNDTRDDIVFTYFFIILCVLTANISTKPAAEQDIIGTKTDQISDLPLSSVTDNVAANFDDEWEQNIEELVSWTNALDL